MYLEGLSPLIPPHKFVPHLISSAAAMRVWTMEQRSAGLRVALVPTMGALHDGHLRLVREASKHADRVIVSIFVNPTQFGPNEDFDAYPRTLESDIAQLARVGCCDVVFAPPVSDMYPRGDNLTWVTVDRMGDHLCGATRPGHFRGVTTIVSRLFAIVGPDVAMFGLKDAQQFFILRRMTQEMGFGIDIRGVPTVRESDGLALSSRNRYLSDDERNAAPLLYRSLKEAEAAIISGGVRDVRTLVDPIWKLLENEPTCRPDYVQLVDTDALQPLNRIESGQQVVLALAAFFGKARLIDNIIVDVP